MHASAPGKLILSGEHAVVYGNPALAVAISQQAFTTITPNPAFAGITLTGSLLPKEGVFFTHDFLQQQHAAIRQRYAGFLQHQCSITEVITQKEQLLIAIIEIALTHCHPATRPNLTINIASSIATGAGLGSSAAVILSMLLGICATLNKPLNATKAFDLALQAENLQHGYSSGLDIRLSLSGGYQWYEQRQLHARTFNPFPLYLLPTGRPICSTGECVTAVKPLLDGKTMLLQQFAEVTTAMDNALTHGHYQGFKAAISQNQRLLSQLGVTPLPIQALIADLEAQGDAAKICGAGAIRGETAGYLLVCCEDNPWQKYQHYPWSKLLEPLSINKVGASPLQPA